MMIGGTHMKKILLPIDGSPRSLRTIQEIKQSYDPKETEITILLVTPEPRPHKMTDDNDEVKPMPDHDEIKSVDENDAEVSRQLLASFARMMPEYKVTPPCASVTLARRSSALPRRAALMPS